MIRGTTPKHIFTTNIDSSTIKELRIIYSQNNQTILTKTKQDCKFDDINGHIITVELTQEETFKFDSSRILDIQLRLKTNDNEVLSTDIISVSVDKCLDNTVL